MVSIRRVVPLTILLALAPAAAALAQQQPAPKASDAAPVSAPSAPGNWWLLDAATDHFYGTSAQRAYKELLANRRPARSVVVAIIDSGIDTAHVELHGNLWTNPKEPAYNGKDDDGDGLVGDVRGWDYIGGPGGKDVNEDTFELTRRFAALRKRFQGANPDTASAQGRADYATYLQLQQKIAEKRSNAQTMLAQLDRIAPVLDHAITVLQQALGADSLTVENVRRLQLTQPDAIVARAQYLQLADAGATPFQLKMARDEARADLEYHLNPDFDPRPVVGDDYANTAERTYGNSDVVGPNALHGTHVAGIVLGVPGNREKLADGTPAVRVMALRAVPDGDERDKDIANAIRFAADHGANVISMSFGKDASPQKDAVDEAVKYAEAHGVLLVHAAGNDAANLDSVSNFPNRYFQAGGQAGDWIEVGASSWRGVANLAAPFSNYSHSRVDLFAPGVDILSTTPGNGHERLSGTSMAAPVVSGIAALLMSYFPSLTAAQVRQILLESATRYPDQMVARPLEDRGEGDGPRLVRFGDLSATGGIINAYAAVQAALQQAPAAGR